MNPIFGWISLGLVVVAALCFISAINTKMTMQGWKSEQEEIANAVSCGLIFVLLAGILLALAVVIH